MTNVKITIHEALREVKMLDKKIGAYLSNLKEAVTVTTAVDKKIGSQTIAEWENDRKADFQSMMDLISRRNAIKQAISESNAKTLIRIDALNQEISVAAAIELQKNGTAVYDKIADVLRFTYSMALKTEEQRNTKAENDAMSYANNILNRKTDNTPLTATDLESVEKTRTEYYENHKAIIRDPISAEKKIKEMADLADAISAEVDSKLSVSNATTILEFSYKNYGEK